VTARPVGADPTTRNKVRSANVPDGDTHHVPVESRHTGPARRVA
jgi:hypothetical protein